ncbi:hypothetical protein [Polyangium fumosum]|uniref:Uncharacterized protein n=1 Tax=Polyangium fumosum TaxID=889272 RepID=A0A4U1I6L4_9BACT|nr:hypothetical protein [Polyangium fumosum]TKC89021.1 hypothetical protein E8A74_51415 [Polyangium fumosum]
MPSSRLTVIMVVAAFVTGCSAPPATTRSECDPNALRPTPECQAELDAGTDASDDANVQVPEPEQEAATCTGRCVPEPSSESAGDWPRTPMLLWYGPRELAPANCDEARKLGGYGDDVEFFEKYRRFAYLDAPPAACECTCPASEGSCTKLPETIEVRAGTCAENGTPALPFGGPAGWDGSCTSTNALPAGADCGGEPCAQSVYASPLPGPTSESCPSIAKPATFTKSTEWAWMGLACEAKEREGTCKTSTHRCMYDLPYPFLQCIALRGIHATCPGNYDRYDPIHLYGELPIDTRGCTACACGGNPVGGACLASLRLYDDAACSSQFSEDPISSVIEQCTNVSLPGRALGAKAITDLAYVPGLCLATGGEPTGAASEDPAEAVTFCCLAPFEFAE